jgi:small-conductance mechanosensitive channel
MEEMQMENETLRNLTDSLATRLHMWEVSAQSSSMALQQSIRMMHRQSGGTPDYAQPSTATTSPVATLTAPPAAADTDARIKELEEQIQRSEKKLESATHENDKLKNVLGRYRDRWEKLKEGAKTRRAEGRSGDGQNNPPASGSSKPSDPSVSPDPGRGPSTGQTGSRAAGDDPA